MLKNYNKEGQKLPLFGVGPYMVWGMGVVSLIGVILIGYVFKIGELYKPWTMIFRIIGILLIVAGIAVWFIGAVRSDMDNHIENNKLKTSGIYAWVRNSMETGRKLAKMMGIPGMKSLFIKIWNPLTKKMFGADSGFKNVFYQNKKGEYRMDVVACPYNKYLTELGCPELTKIFCANDDRCYGNLPGIEFKKSGTLGTGAERCDFYLRKL